MGTTVSASCICKPLATPDNKSSGLLRFMIESSATEIGYTEYRERDRTSGFTKEIRKTYREGLANRDNRVSFTHIVGTSLSDPMADYNDPLNNVVHDSEYGGVLDFMPMLEVKSDENPRGLTRKFEKNEDRVSSEKIAKAMGLTLEGLETTFTGNSPIPQIGTSGWSNIGKQYRQAGGSPEGEQTYRNQLVRDRNEKMKNDKDITDVTVGQFGRFDIKNSVSPAAVLKTYLSCLERTSSALETSAGTTSGTTTSAGSFRRFGISGKLFSAIYSLNGYILREVPGLIPSNKEGRRGYGNINVVLERNRPLVTNKGITLHNDFSDTNVPFFNKAGWSAGLPDMYVEIQVQISTEMYLELVMVDLYQETTIEGKGETRRSNSGNQDDSQKEMTWEEAYIAESFIPLTMSSMLEVRLFDRGSLLVETKSYFIQVVNVQKEKWYQTGLFKAIVRVIGAIISYWLGPVGMTFAQFVIQMLVQVAIQYAIGFIIQVLVKLGIISAEVAIWLELAITVIGSYYGVSGFNLDFTNPVTILNLVEATGKTYAAKTVRETAQFKKDMAELKEKEEELEKEAKGTKDMHLPSQIGFLMNQLQQQIDAIDVPLREDHKLFLARTTDRQPKTQPITYEALKAQLYII